MCRLGSIFWSTFLTLYLLINRPVSGQLSPERLRELFNHNFNEVVRRGKCLHPKPQLVYLESEVTETRGGIYLPAATWLHRCAPSTGCCSRSDETCTWAAAEPVTKVFKKLSNNQLVAFTMNNHTSCRCKKTRDIPR